jgi:hypothetical protein
VLTHIALQEIYFYLFIFVLQIISIIGKMEKLIMESIYSYMVLPKEGIAFGYIPLPNITAITKKWIIIIHLIILINLFIMSIVDYTRLLIIIFMGEYDCEKEYA